MITVKARVRTHAEETPVVPIVVPDRNEVRAFSKKLHAEGKPWQGEVFGWQAE